MILKYRKALLTLIIILAFISSLWVLGERIRAERANNNVELSMDYSTILSMCRDEGLSMDEVLITFKEAGITTIAFSEITLDQLREQGRLQYMTGFELAGILGLSGSSSQYSHLGIEPNRIYVINYESSLGESIAKKTKLFRGKDSLQELSIKLNNAANKENGAEFLSALEIRGNVREIPFSGLGFDEEALRQVRNMGFLLTLRPENRDTMTSEDIEKYFSYLYEIEGVSTVIFGGGSNEVIGFPLELDTTLKCLKNADFYLGDIEVPSIRARQRGSLYLGQKIPNRVVRVQSITPQYLAKMDPENAVDMFRLGVRERNIRFLYLRPYPRGIRGKSLLKTNFDYISHIKSELNRYGFNLNRAAVFPLMNPPAWVVVLISLASGAVFLLLIDLIYPDKPHWAVWVMAAALIFPLMLIIPGKLHWAQKIIGLALGILFPVYAVSLHFEEMGFIETEKKLTKIIGFAALSFLKISLITIFGSLIFAALFSSTTYMLTLDQVRGIKVLLLVPPMLIVLLYYLKGSNSRQSLQGILSSPLYIWQVVVMGAVAAAGLVAALRSGNTAEFLTSDHERQIRVMMEQIFWVRPRFKDFAIGHPALIITMALSYMHKYAGLGIFILFGAIGQADIMDTFAHVHTPVFISLVRTVTGILLGLIIGLTAVCIIKIIDNYLKPKTGETAEV